MKNIFCSALMILVIGSFIGCKKDNAVAPTPVEDLIALSGRNRAVVKFEAPANARSGKVFFGNGNFTGFEITSPGTMQEVLVEGLQEQEETLRVVTISADGIVSEPRAVKVQVYGSQYESSLRPRKWADQVTHSANSLEFFFQNALADESALRVVYTGVNGSADSVEINSNAQAIVIDNMDTTKPYYYYSVYKPVETSIDEFYSATVDLKTALMLNFKKENWTIAGSSGDETGFDATNLIDNNAETGWRSAAGGSFPHWVSIDMETPKYISGFYYLNHTGKGNGPESVRFEVSDDNSTWRTVLLADVGESYFRQRLPLQQTVTARYLRVSPISMRNPAAVQTEMIEIDAYNDQNGSGDNGYISSTALTLTNAKMPFTGDGSNPFPALGAFRLQRVSGWVHNPNAVATYDDAGKEFCFFVAPVWGLGEVSNGKVYQTVSVQPGEYIVKVQVGGADGPADVYGLISETESLPDYGAVPNASSVIEYANLTQLQNRVVEMRAVVTSATNLHIGFVYNLRSQYSINGIPWSTFKIRGVELFKVE